MASLTNSRKPARWEPRTPRAAVRLTLNLCLGTASVAGLLHLLLPGPAFLIALVLAGPIALWYCHPRTDGQTATLGAVVSGGAAVALFLLAGLGSLLLFLIGLLTGEGTALPVAFEAAPYVWIGSMAGGGAASLAARILADAVAGASG